jgi:hypothetical protein
MSLGGILITPVVAFLINRYGLAGAAPWLAGALVLGIVPVTALVVRSSPQSRGMEPDGLTQSSADTAAAAPDGVPFSEAVQGCFFAATTVVFTLIFAAPLGAVTHVFRLVSLRADERAAAVTLALMAAASLIGRFIGGWLLTYISPRVFSLALMTSQVVALVILAYAFYQALIFFAAVSFGFGMGNIITAAHRGGVRHARLQPHLCNEPTGRRRGAGGRSPIGRLGQRSKRLHRGLSCGSRRFAHGRRSMRNGRPVARETRYLRVATSQEWLPSRLEKGRGFGNSIDEDNANAGFRWALVVNVVQQPRCHIIQTAPARTVPAAIGTTGSNESQPPGPPRTPQPRVPSKRRQSAPSPHATSGAGAALT